MRNAAQTLGNGVQLGGQSQQQQQQQLQQRQQQQLLAQSIQGNVGAGGIQTPTSGLGSNLSTITGLSQNSIGVAGQVMNPTVMSNRLQQMQQQQRQAAQQQQVVQQQQVCLAALMFRTMLHQYIGECMVSIINTNNGIKEPTSGYQNCLTIQMLIFGGHLKMRESFYARVITWVNTILNLIDARVVLSRYEDSCMVYRPEYMVPKNKNALKHSYPTSMRN